MPKAPTISIPSASDRGFLEQALELGRRGWGRVQPNPMVGCVIVRQGKVVGEGWHREFGGPHAEVMALSEAGGDANGATAFVSLEPCRHHGKTPACSAALLKAGIARVVFGAADPGLESGQGAEDLKAAGVDVIGPVLTERECRLENPAFFWTAPDRPWVALKLAVSLDGMISSGQGVRTEISGAKANARVQWLRAGFDAILVGTTTALVDDPLLTVRGRLKPRTQPRRYIVDAHGRIGPKARVLNEGDTEVAFLTTHASPPGWRTEIEAAGGSVAEVAAGPNDSVSLPDALRLIREQGVRTLLCEGGGRIGSEFLALGMVDRLYLIVAPKLIGSGGVPAFRWADDSQGAASSNDTGWRSTVARWRLVEEPRMLGDDVWMVLEPEAD